MKLAIISDFHLGFASGSAREQECYENAKQALELAVRNEVDAILLAGDLFDEAIPRQETWHRSFDVFSIPKRALTSDLKISYEKKDSKSEYKYTGIPVVAIHGTHEFRGQDYANALDVLQTAGFILRVHAGKAILEKGSEKIVVQGIGGIPEKKALDALRTWNPKPNSGAVNIIMLHQSIKEFLPFDDEKIATIALENLPKGFDLIVDGHLHWHNTQILGTGKFLLPGSTIITQMKNLESEKPKGICLYDTLSKKIDFLPLPNQRKLFYHKIKFSGETPEQIKEKITKTIESDLRENFPIPPLIRLKLVGNLAKGYSPSDVSFAEIEQKFHNRVILSIGRDFQATDFKKKIADLRQQQKSKQSVAARGLEILEKNLQEAKFDNAFDVRRVFKLLEEGENDKAIEILTQKR